MQCSHQCFLDVVLFLLRRFRWASAEQQKRQAQELLDRNLRDYDTARAAAAAGRKQRQLAQAAGAQEGAGQHGIVGGGLDSPLPPAHVKLPRPFRGDVSVDDAFATIMQWWVGVLEGRFRGAYSSCLCP
jgi:hypothetical protein